MYRTYFELLNIQECLYFLKILVVTWIHRVILLIGSTMYSTWVFYYLNFLMSVETPD